jgi:DNA repair exonuclease SbcCD ATPase subunit
MKIVHIADVHWRGLSRHDEYTSSFIDFFNQCRDIKPDVIYVGGDIVHSKTQGISPELIDRLRWWFTSMAEICPVHVILGNHDGLILNKDRQDAITPIISAIDNPNIHLYKKSGVYPIGVPGFNWCVFSCFDEAGWQRVRPIEGDVNIALFHGAVWGSKTDIDWELEGDVTVDLFDNFEFAMLGDIHRRQFLNEKKTIAYSGSTIQQNYGEDIGKGFLLWDIESKDKFTVKFHEISHCSPFITVDWAGTVKDTLDLAKKYSPGSRFRIKSKSQITQADSQEISSRLRSDMNALEVVFKSENQFDASEFLAKKDAKDSNLRDISTHYDLFGDFLKSFNLNQEEKDDIKDLIDKYFSAATSSEEVLRNSRWEIEKMYFDNVFSYGEENVIDFTKNTGITGIFGKNTKGKSSIIGALMYSLFNTTDRGPIKNLHIINSRKNFCNSSVDIKLNGERIRVARETVKHTTRKGEIYASTSLDLKKISASGDVIENLAEEQRRETEKVLRSLIGTSDDFLMTSLASQGGMNKFISEGSTSRKSILTKFLDLEVFEKMSDLCKQDYSELRALSKAIKQEDWDKKIEEENELLVKSQESLLTTKLKIKSDRDILQNLIQRRSSMGNSSEEFYTEGQILKKKEEIENLEASLSKRDEDIVNLKDDAQEKKAKLDKIAEVCENISIDSLKSQKDTKIALEKNLIKLKSNYERAASRLETLKESAEKLNQVPCGDSYPACMFIKSSHDDKLAIEDQVEIVKIAYENLNSCKKSLEIIKKIDPAAKIKKYEALFLKSKDLENQIKVSRERLINLENKRSSLVSSIENLSNDLRKMEMLTIDSDDNKTREIQEKINSVRDEIELLEKSQTSIIEKIAANKINVESLIADRENHNSIKQQMRSYDRFIQAVSRKGIPTKIMMSKLPVINTEISNILLGVVDFTVSLEADMTTNSMDIYIDYGDSKRIIELASGMEKMISSLAMRVALINTSSLTKTNMMIIDEGFGSLDATNLEACTRLLESLKKWFKNIIVISHVDAVKDCVDNSVEITKKGKDSYVKFL